MRRKQWGGVDGSMFAEMIQSLVIICVLTGFALGGVVFFVIPWLWRLARPWLHAITG